MSVVVEFNRRVDATNDVELLRWLGYLPAAGEAPRPDLVADADRVQTRRDRRHRKGEREDGSPVQNFVIWLSGLGAETLQAGIELEDAITEIRHVG